jgi:hypothetical protein
MRATEARMTSLSQRLRRAGSASLLVLAFGWAVSAQAARVTAVTPQGEVAVVRQVSVRFDAAMVNAADPRAAAPLKLTCNGQVPPGDGRWLDEKRWVYDLIDVLPAGQRCTLKLEPQFKPLAGGAIEGPGEFAFSTGAPGVLSVSPWPGSRIEEDQHFLLHLNGAVDPASVQRSAWCEAEGLGERIGVIVVTGSVREQVLRRQGRRRDAAHSLLLACQRTFAAEARVRLVWGAGILSVPAAGHSALATRAPAAWQWQVRSRFAAEFSCERENAAAPCLPLRPLTLRFNAPVPREAALGVRLVPAGATPIAPKLGEEEARSSTLNEVQFAAPLPENTRFSITLPAGLKDESGRELSNAGSFPLLVSTGGLPPLAKFAGAPFGILEAGSGEEPAMLPLTLRHVQADLAGAATGGQISIRRIDPALPDAELLAWIGRLRRWHEQSISAKEAGLPPSLWSETVSEADERGRKREVKRERQVPAREHALLAADSEARRAELPQLQGSTPRATEVLGVPLTSRGYHVVEVSSRVLGDSLLGRAAPMHVRTGVLVTNLAVHFKRGRGSSLVWVTTLDRGRPVAGARVAVNDCNGKPLWSGGTDAAGIARIDRGFEDDVEPCQTSDGLFVTARHGADLGFVFSRWMKGIEPWRFGLATAGGTTSDLRAHTVFDRELLRVGETVSMKHFVRAETERGLAFPPREALPDTVLISHLGSGQEYTVPLAWPGGAQGARSAESRWAIPKTAPLGLYQVGLRRGEKTLQSGAFRVEAFRVPLTDARLAGPKGVIIAPLELPLEAQVNAMAGGPMPGLALKVSAQLRESAPRFAGYDEFVFERSRRDADTEGEAGESGSARSVAHNQPATTDALGAARLTLGRLPALRGPSELLAELSFADPNGEVQTVSRRFKLWPSAVVVGLRAPDWAAHREAARFTVVVLDTEGKPLAGQAVSVSGRVHTTLSTRRRIVGGFYAYDNQHRVSELGALCEGKTDNQGRLNCDAKVERAGEIELIARAKDPAGRESVASTHVWVTSEERQWFAQDNHDRIDVLPEKRELEPGQSARLQVRMPYSHATALVTVEREGVLEARVMQLSGREPVLELPVPADLARSWAPNVTVGVFVLRGRLREAPWWSIFTWGWRDPADWWRAFRYEGKEWRAPTAMVDLARPSYKFGATQLAIGAAAHRLDVKVSTPQVQYKVRETVHATVQVTWRGQPMPGAEVAFAAVDEGLLALAENKSWDLLAGLLRERPWGVETATAASEVIGRRHYGRKALPAGGGGGRNPTRELFDTLLLWRGTVQLDAAGFARIDVPLNDSLTSFRLVAIADAGPDRFGLGHAVVRVAQDLQMLSGLAPLVREGDRFDAGFTLRNASPRAMAVQATLAGQAIGADGLPRGAITLAPQNVQLAAGAANELRWSVTVPEGAARIEWTGGALEQGGAATATGAARDAVKIVQAVVSPVPVRVWQATLAPLSHHSPGDGGFTQPVAPPEGALPGRGGVQVSLMPKLSGALPGLKRFFETYPYSCLEQRFSRTVALGDEAAWKALRDETAGYLDPDGLANYFPPAPGSEARGSDRLTAYLLAASHEAGLTWPDATRNAMLEGLAAFVQGRLERRFPAPRPDLDVRKLAALEALARHGRADARWFSSIAFTPNTWPTSALLDAASFLQRLPPGGGERDARLAEVQRHLRSRLTEGGTTLKFSNEAEDEWWWLMESADGNAAKLVLAAVQDPGWKEDVPRLVNGALARQKGGAWRTTTANLWGVLALQRFAKVFESEAVSGKTNLQLGATSRQVDWAVTAAGDAVLLPWGTSPAAFTARHEGAGKPWIHLQSLAAVPLTAPLAAGYRLSRSVSPVQKKTPQAWSRGDIMRVRLEIDAAADMSWVVLSDPLPSGAALLGGGLGRDSAIAAQGERREGNAWLAYEERGTAAWRAYYAWLPRGRHVIEYTLRLNASGRFGLPPARVEAMYAPESFGELPVAALEVRP